jgi:cbb3-type cytochrome oxidase cytochrome c subunit
VRGRSLAGLCVVVVVASGCGASGLRLSDQQRDGARIFVVTGCMNCHLYGGAGSRSLGAPELTQEGRKRRGVDWQIRHLECPRCVRTDSPMPSFSKLGAEDLSALAVFLEGSDGPIDWERYAPTQ